MRIRRSLNAPLKKEPQCVTEKAFDQASFIAGLNRSGRKRMSSSHVLSA